MNKEYKIKLDLNKKIYNKKMTFNQFDENVNDFYIEITKNNEVVKDLDKSIVTLVAIKPNGEVDAQFIEVKEGQIYADLKPSMCDLVGNYQAKAMIVLEGEIVTTDTINYSVSEDKIISKLNEDVVSDERFTLFTDALARLSDIESSEEQRMINEAERILSEENRKIEEAKRVEAELIRQHEEADRAKYDATRESNENIRKQNESIRLANETNRIDEEAKRVEEEAKRVQAEQLRKDNYNFMTEDEERRRSEANAHKEAEVLRVQAETNRVNEEAKRRNTEQARVSAENTRVSNENVREASEVTRKNNETQRVEAETQRQSRYNSFITDAEANANNFENYTNTAKVKEEERKSNELDRKSQETKRVSNEVERISNENTRKANEVTRIESEKQRIDAENLRKEKIIEIQSDYDSLKKVIIDENASANLQNQINQTNSQLEHKATKLDNVIYLQDNKNFIGDGVSDDSAAIQEAINQLEILGGGKLVFPYKKNIKLTKQGERAIKTWHTSVYKRMYSLLLPSNVEIDFNFSTIIVEPDLDTKGMVMAFENKNADNTSEGDYNITIRNLIVDCNMTCECDYDINLLGQYDRHGISFNNINNLTLENVKVLNTMGYGIYICNTRNFKLLGEVVIENNMGCAFRLGYSDNTKNGYIQNLKIINNSDKYENWLPTNTVYVICEDLIIDNIIQECGEITKTSSNFANGCKNICITKYKSVNCGIKLQNYKNTHDDSPTDFNMNRVDVLNGLFNIQSRRCFINELSFSSSLGLHDSLNTNISLNIWDSDTTTINKLFLTNANISFKSNNSIIYNTVINEIYSYNSCILSTTLKGKLRIGTLRCVRDSNVGEPLNNNSKWLLYYPCEKVDIDSIEIINDISCDMKTNLINIGKNGTIRSVLGNNTNGNVFVTQFKITLTSGTSTTIDLNSLPNSTQVYKNSNNMFYEYEIVPVNSSGRGITISKKEFTNCFDRLIITHSSATGEEEFMIKINKYVVGEDIDW